MTEEVKDKKEEVIKEEAAPLADNIDKKAKPISPFIQKDYTIVCTVGYYLKEDGTGFMVEGVQDEFNPELATDSFDVTFRLPTQKDANIVSTRINSAESGESEMGIFSAFSKLEYVRFLVLLVGWTLPKPPIEESVEELHPSFVKGIISALREKIGTDGIV